MKTPTMPGDRAVSVSPASTQGMPVAVACRDGEAEIAGLTTPFPAGGADRLYTEFAENDWKR